MSKIERLTQAGKLAGLLVRNPRYCLETVLFSSKSVCFSNYGEDLVLARMFTLPKHGFYVDVGANHPIIASNTLRLALMGWRGIAVEPNPDLAGAFAKVRRECTVVQCGVGVSAGELEYIRFDRNQCNTFDAEMAEFSARRGAREIGRSRVKVETLASILDTHVGNAHIDVMSIDVEGYDYAALESNDWARWKPSIVLIEDHLPIGASLENSQIGSFLVGHGYLLAARVHFTSFFVRSDSVEKLAW